MIQFCLHRVNNNKSDAYSLSAKKLLGVLRILDSLPISLTLSFDDGYLDSLHFIQEYAPQFPNIDWIFFICPLRAQSQTDFQGIPSKEFADCNSLRLLSKLPNVLIGNHTNHHFKQSTLNDSETLTEYEESIALFSTLFGECEAGLAFPYGTPHSEFDYRAVDICRKHHLKMWSTEAIADDSKAISILVSVSEMKTLSF